MYFMASIVTASPAFFKETTLLDAKTSADPPGVSGAKVGLIFTHHALQLPAEVLS